MLEPTGLNPNRNVVRRSAPTRPLDASVLERVTKPLEEQAVANGHSPEEVSGFLGMIKGVVNKIMGDKPVADFVAEPIAEPDVLQAQVALDPQAKGLESSGVAGRDPSLRSWGMVTMAGTAPTLTESAPASNGGGRSWGMVSMDDAIVPINATTPVAPPGMFRSWGMVQMEKVEVKVEPPAPPLAVAPPAQPVVEKPAAPVTPKPVAPTPEKPNLLKPFPPAVPPGGVTLKPGTGIGADLAPTMNPAARAAAIAKVKATLGPVDAALIDRIDKDGTLDEVGANGKTVLEGLADMTNLELSDKAKLLGFTPASILKQTVQDLADPTLIKQKAQTDCVWTNLRFHMAKDQPADYVQAAIELYRDGSATLRGGGTVELEDALKPFDLGGNVGHITYKDGQLWMTYKGMPPMPAEEMITLYLNDPNKTAGILQRNPELDNPIIKGIIDTVRSVWNGGDRIGAMQMIAPFVEMWMVSNPDKNLDGVRYALNNFRGLFGPATQAVGAMPNGIALGKVDEFYPGLKGFKYDTKSLEQLNTAVIAGAEVPVAFTTDAGTGLHLATVMGRSADGSYIIYDPEEGPRSLPEAVLKERAVAIFLPSTMGLGLADVPDSDMREVGGGRFRWRGTGG